MVIKRSLTKELMQQRGGNVKIGLKRSNTTRGATNNGSSKDYSTFLNQMKSFKKYHGLGNDFVVIDNVSRRVSLTSEDVIRLADRHYSIGFDQLLLVEPLINKFFNSCSI